MDGEGVTKTPGVTSEGPVNGTRLPTNGSEPTAGTRPRTGAAIGAACVVAIVWIGHYLNRIAHAFEQLGDSTISVTFPHLGAFTLTAWGLTALLIWFFSRLLHHLGERSPVAVAAGLVLAGLALVLSLSLRYGWDLTTAQVFACTTGTLLFGFVVLGWRLRARRLLWRLPPALVGYPAVVLLLVPAITQAQVSWHRHVTLADVTPAVIDSQKWEAVEATTDVHGGLAISYDQKNARTGEVTVTYPSHPAEPGQTCGMDLEDCERHGTAFVSDEDFAGARTALIRLEGEAASVEWSLVPLSEDEADLGEVAEHVRFANESDLDRLAHLLVG
ncbi:hypothetical protein [Halostreptopolyspora alba]|uniref:Uncharacterized protein n=1 Tax=Halostreptopolyspora alba TaxID=2487137 RepID=A0A3N0EF08_9ACTN|nr:hypothetical protein EFW17_04120 [Nocardiopsaceae bacterium YIM 96095]